MHQSLHMHGCKDVWMHGCIDVLKGLLIVLSKEESPSPRPFVQLVLRAGGELKHRKYNTVVI